MTSNPTPLAVAGGTDTVKAVMPSPPEWLINEARTEWRRLGPKLFALGLLSDLDRGAFAALCQAYGTWASAEKTIAKLRTRKAAEAASTADLDAEGGELAGMVFRTAAGNLVHHPLASIAAKARAEYVKQCEAFGLTPAARARIDTDGAKNKSEGGGARRFLGRTRA